MKIPPLFLALFFLITTASCLWATEEGYSTAVAVQKVLVTDTTALGQPLSFPSKAPAVTGIVVTIPPGGETGWHKHPYSGFAYILEGTLTVETEKGTSTTFPTGSSFAEVVLIAHNGKNLGKVSVKLVAFFTASKGEPISVKHSR